MASTEGGGADFAEAPLAAHDIDAACGLVAEAGWNQDAADWRIFLEHGSAIAVKTPGRRLVATAATLPYPSGFGWISMVLVAAAFRRRGIATRLLEACISRLRDSGMTPVLDATPAGSEVYRPLGFREGWPIQRWRRRSPDTVSPKSAARTVSNDDWSELLRLDAQAFGCDRSWLLEGLHRRSSDFACVVEERGKLRGFLLGREGRLATQLGPIVAADDGSAAYLAAYALGRLKGQVIVDTLQRHTGFGAWLEAHGFERERPYTRMALGRDELFGDPQRTFAIAGPELG